MGLPTEALQVGLPALAVGRVGEHEVELLTSERIIGQGRPLGTTHEVVRRLAVALEDEVGFRDGVGLGVDLLPIQVRGDLLAQRAGELLERLLSDSQHAAGTHRPVVEAVRARGNPVSDRLEHEAGHQPHRVTWRPVLTRFLVVVLVEPAHQLFEHGAHAVVVQARRGKIEVGRAELLDERSQGICFGELGKLVAKVEVLDDLLHVRGEAVEVRLEVLAEPRLVGRVAQVLEGET